MRIRRALPFAILVCLALLALAGWAQEATETPTDWESLAAQYNYDPSLPLDVSAAGEIVADGQLRRVEFTSVNEQRVPAMVGLPAAGQHGAGPYPAVVLGHGLGGSKDDSGLRMAAQMMLMQGYATITIDYPNHGERRSSEMAQLKGLTDPTQMTPELAAALFEQILQGAKQTVFDQRRAVDYLCSLPQIDRDHIGYAGVSLGAILGTVFTAVEPRVKASVLIVGGADWKLLLEKSMIPGLPEARAQGAVNAEELGSRLAVSDPKYFASHVQCPTLLLFGAQDDIVPYEPCGKLLGELMGGPKTIQVLEDWGHGPKPGASFLPLLTLLQQFLTTNLQPAQ